LFRVLFSPLREISLLLPLACTLPAQQPISFQYIYDDLNQLIKVIDSTGVVVSYVYDAVGNITQITRSSVVPGALTIFSVTPASVGQGNTITIQGQGFNTNPSLNTVTINGLAAQVLSATSTVLVVKVPGGATSGSVAVTVAGATAISPAAVNVLPIPSVTSVSPLSALAGTTIASFTVTGTNLTGATFAFAPILNIGSVSVNTSGTSATLSVAIGSAAVSGRYVVVATNAAGSSDPGVHLGFLPGSPPSNTLTIPGSSPTADPDNDGLTNAQEIALGTDPLNFDTDGDGYPDGLEVALGSNPLDPLSVPNLQSRFVAAKAFSILNTLNPGIGQPVTQRPLFSFSILNINNPGSGHPVTRQPLFTFSILNTNNPGSGHPVTQQPLFTFSILNAQNPGSGQMSSFVSEIFSIDNTAMAPLAPLTSNTGRPRRIPAGIPATPSERRRFLSAAPYMDTDHDGLPDFLEILLGSDPNNPDSDGDGLSDGLEFILKGDPFSARPEDDDDGDGLTNIDEVRYGTDPDNPDTDGDGLSDGAEVLRYHTNPLVADTDGDGYPDGLEVALGTDPLDPRSFPNLPVAFHPLTLMGPTFSIHLIKP
jgi:YD repeat-containing protein